MRGKYDFSGYVTKNDLVCSDGLTIRRDAFKGCDGKRVPLVWQHQHNDPTNVLGHAILENRPDGVYGYCTFNDTPKGKHAKAMVEHGDIEAMSIFANQLKKVSGNVTHGIIREVSLVLAGANPGALIDMPYSMEHSIDGDEDAVIYTDELIHVGLREGDTIPDDLIEAELEHAESENDKRNADDKGGTDMPTTGRTIQDIYDAFDEEQKDAVHALIGFALEDAKGGEEEDMKHNIFDAATGNTEEYLSHAEVTEIFAEAQRNGRLSDAVLAHGIEDINFLFPEARTYQTTPDFIKRDTGWVSDFLGSVHHTPFSRVKSLHGNITADEARARGYVKGNFKAEEVIALLKRVTNPQTIYKKQKIDRDDMIDITDFDVAAWIKGEMRGMLDEEIARAGLIGDGRTVGTEDKISEDCIRPIWTDSDVYTIKALGTYAANATADDKAKLFIRTCIKNRKYYKGSGNPTLFTTEDMLTDCLLLEDNVGRVLYETPEKLATALRVKKIVTVPVMENQSRLVSGDTHYLGGIIVNPDDYNIGADKGGAVNLFDDFDIDYNAMKYLIETRCSGALTKPYSAIAVELKQAQA